MTDGTKICTACKWCDWPSLATGQPAIVEITAFCFHDDAKTWPSRITGEKTARPCTAMRHVAGPCGVDGKLWDAKGSKAVTP